MNLNELGSDVKTIFQCPLIKMGESTLTLLNLIHFILILAIAIFISRYARVFLRRKILSHTKMDSGLQYVIARMFSYVLFVIAILIGLQTLGVDLTSFTVLAGAFGLGIGFGLQNIINNFVSGLIILSERLIQVGDRIEVGTATGIVKRIGARCSLITTPDNALVIVPNSDFMSTRVVNWHQGIVRSIRFEISLQVGYESDIEMVEKILFESALNHPQVLRDPLPIVELQRFGDSGIEYKLFFWSQEMANKGGTLKAEIQKNLLNRLKANKIELPYAIQEIRFKDKLQAQISYEKESE